MKTDEVFAFSKAVRQVKLHLEWAKHRRIIAYSVFSFDYKARLVSSLRSELNIGNKPSDNKIPQFLTMEQTDMQQKLNIDLTSSNDIVAFLLTIDGFENFNQDDEVMIDCYDDTEYSDHTKLLQIRTKMLASYQGLFVCILYIDGFHIDSRARWILKAVEDPMYAYSISEQESFCTQKVVKIVPSFEKFRFRLFANVRSVCAALSSQSLPKLKDKFLKYPNGVNKILFTELIFNNLYESHPKILDPEESAYSVAIIRELFNSIDFSGDELVSWEEFTTFVIQTVVAINSEKNEDLTADENAVVEYEEDVECRDRVLSAHTPVSVMRYFPETKTILVVPMESEFMLVFSSKNFTLRARIDPNILAASGNMMNDDNPLDKLAGDKRAKINILDVVYLAGKDLYCFSADDYSLSICREVVILGGKRVSYNLTQRILHTLNHPLLCWSLKHQVLVSVSTTNVLFGWDIEAGTPIYQSQRHSAVITGIISVNSIGYFATCSMDRSIIFQSAATGRVKAVLKGHSRGVKCIDANAEFLISGGFDCEAKVWALDSRDVIVRLQGHRKFIVQCKLMCERAQSDHDYRAVTCDDSGEFRVWDIHISERFVEPVVRVALQVFEMVNPQLPMNKIKYIALGYEAFQNQSSSYAQIMAIGAKLLKFKPKKSAKDFLSATCCAYNVNFGTVLIANGRDIAQYELVSGKLEKIWKDISSSDITAMCSDAKEGKTYFLGNNAGSVISINYRAGSQIDSFPVSTAEISCIASFQESFLVVGSVDGSLMVIRDQGGSLLGTTWHCPEVFGSHIAISKIVAVGVFHLAICTSAKTGWCVWDPNISLPSYFGKENNTVTAVEIIGTYIKTSLQGMESAGIDGVIAERLVTFAIASTKTISIYTFDQLSTHCFCIYSLIPDNPIYITQFTILRKGPCELNYSSPYAAALIFIGMDDSGDVSTWDFDSHVVSLQVECERRFRAKVASKSVLIRMKRHRYQSLAPDGTKTLADYDREAVLSTSTWRAHLDSITAFCTLPYYGCFITVANDGFARVWNLHQDCLGEMKLPNITDEMKDYQLHAVSNGLWNLILERKAFNMEEQETAEQLVAAIHMRNASKRDDNDSFDDLLLDSAAMMSGANMRGVDGLGSSSTMQRLSDVLALNREMQLQSLVQSTFHADKSLDSMSLSFQSMNSLHSITTMSSATLSKPISIADLSFGQQTSYYKNAEKVINANKKQSITRAKHLIELGKIDRKVKSIQVARSASENRVLDEKSLLEKTPIMDVLRREEEQSQMRRFKSSLLVPADAIRRPIDKDEIKLKSDLFVAIMTKELKRDDTRAQLQLKQRVRRKEHESYEERAALERKLQNSILFILAGPKEKMIGPRKKLRTRDVLPSYTLQDVTNFIELINKVDMDFSGSLDIHEWISLFQTTGSSIQAHQAVSMFDGAETKAGGKLYISDLVPMIFPKANKHQRKLIIEYTESEIFTAKSINKVKETNKEPLSVYDMERLFECYDTKCLGFIPLKFIRERLGTMQLPIGVLVEVQQDLYSDDYASIEEFLKIFRLFIDDPKKEEEHANKR